MRGKKMPNTIIIQLLNNAIEEAINYGGDRGGAYYTEEYLENLVAYMKSIASFLPGKCEVKVIDHVPKIVISKLSINWGIYNGTED